MHKKLPFFYGWIIVATMSIVTMAQTAEFNPVLGVFLKPMTQEFGWTRATFAGAITIGTITGGLCAIVIGPLLDKIGPRWILFWGFFLMGWTIVGLSAVGELWHFYALMISSRTLVSGIIAISTGVVISKWFIVKRGRAMAFATMGTRIGNSFMPLFVQSLLGVYGWRIGAIGLGSLTWALTLIPTSLFLRRKPEDLGLLPDGLTQKQFQNQKTASSSTDQNHDISLGAKEALRTKSFYFILFATCCLYYGGAGINFNLFPFLTDQGINPEVAVRVLTIWSLLSVIGGLTTGFLAEKIHVRWLMSIIIFLVSLTVGFLSTITDVKGAYIFAVAHGIPWGGVPMLQQLVWADYFGRESQGSIRGITTPIQMFMNGMGPLTATLIFDSTGSYVLIFRIFALAFMLASIGMLAARPIKFNHLNESSIP